MTILPVIAACAVVLVIAYFTYGRVVVRWLGIDPARPTPAVELDDGNDYVPAPVPVVLGGHFTAIAAAGPVVGPILGALAFGWAPALLWIIVGSILIGGVHDAAALFASIRHRAGSITQVVRQHMSRTAYVTFLLFVWISLIYVIIAFADVTAGTFAGFQQFGIPIDGQVQNFSINGGAIVIGAAAYLVMSVVLGLVLRFTKTKWYAALVVCVMILALIIWQSPRWAMWLSQHGLPFMDTQGKHAGSLTKNWDQALLVYCFVASIVPMWLLLQPRGVIGATFLYATLLFGVAGAVVGGLFTGDQSLAITWPAFSGFFGNGETAKGLAGAWLFPFLFITIACGACSGFHSIVASGTTSKQVRTERDVKPVGYGAMLLEAMVAIFALSCVMVMVPNTTGKPDAVYARGIGNFMRICGIDMQFAVTFGLLAFSSFVFDTLDVCTRLGRYVLQEMLGLKGLSGGALATLVTLTVPSVYLWKMPAGSFMTFWTIFGTSNQLLAALTLIGVSVWLWRTGRPVWFTLAPAAFMVASTATALVLNFRGFLRAYNLKPPTGSGMLILNMFIAALLLMLAGLVVFEALRVWRMSRLRAAPVAVAV
jgi:carbon starvation protein